MHDEASVPGAVTVLILAKLREQVERIEHLLCLAPPDRLDWLPALASPAFPFGVLLGHLLECLAGFCAVLERAHPEHLPHFVGLKDQAVNHACGVAEAQARIGVYRSHIEQGFACLSDADLVRRLPTVFVPEGEAVATLILGNLEHLINHKFQLFYYLKMMGCPVGTADLYRLRGPARSAEVGA